MNGELEPPIGPKAAVRGCPPSDHLAALAGDALPTDVREAVSAHVARCPACRALASDLASLPEADLPAGLDGRVPAIADVRGRRSLLAAAAVLAALGLAGWWSVRAPGRPNEPQAAVARPVQSAPPAPVGRWKLDKPDIVLPAATVLVMRGADPSAAALTTALEPYRANDFSAAAKQLDAFVSTHPDSADAWFYLGASRLLLDADAEARAALDKATTLHAERTHPELEWLLATAEARTGATGSARDRLTRLCGTAGLTRERACAALGALR